MSSDIRSVTYDDAVAPTQSDATNDPNGPFAAFYVGTAGDVKVTTIRGSNVVFKNCLAGLVYTVAHLRVWSTGTAASNILCLRAPGDVR